MAVTLKLENVSKSFARVETRDITTALDDINLEMHDGEFISLVGTSGCGKSTMLRLIAGLIVPTQGLLTVNGEKIEGPDPSRGMMFQKATLFPWLTVENNIAFSMKMRHEEKKPENKAEVERMLKVIGLKISARIILPSFRAAWHRGWPWPAALSASRKYCFWTSRWVLWTLLPA